MISMISNWFNDNQITKLNLNKRSSVIRLIVIAVIVVLSIFDVIAATQMQVLTKQDHRTLTAGYQISAKEAKNIDVFKTSVLVDKKNKIQYAAVSAMRPAKVEKYKNKNYDPKAKKPSTKQPAKKFLKKLQHYEQVRNKYNEKLVFTGGPQLRMAMVSAQDGKSTVNRLPITTTLTQAPYATISRLARRHYYYNIRMTSEIRKVVNDGYTIKPQKINGFELPTWKLNQSQGKHTISVTYGYPKSVIQKFANAKSRAIQMTILIWLAIAVIFWVISGILVTGAEASKSIEQGEKN